MREVGGEVEGVGKHDEGWMRKSWLPEERIRVLICNPAVDQKATIVILRRQCAVLCLLTTCNVGLGTVVTDSTFQFANHVRCQNPGVRLSHVRKLS